MSTQERYPFNAPLPPPGKRGKENAAVSGRDVQKPKRELEPGQSYAAAPWSDGPVLFEAETRRNERGADVPVPNARRAIVWQGHADGEAGKRYRYVVFHDDSNKPKREEWERLAEKSNLIPPKIEADIHWYGALEESKDGGRPSWSRVGEAEDLGMAISKELAAELKNAAPEKLRFILETPPSTIQ